MGNERATRWVTVNEAARRLSMSTSGLRKQISRGLVPIVHVGRSLRVDWARLEQRLEAEILRMEDEDVRCGRDR